MKKKKFDPINFIPNQSKYQRGIFKALIYDPTPNSRS